MWRREMGPDTLLVKRETYLASVRDRVLPTTNDASRTTRDEGWPALRRDIQKVRVFPQDIRTE